MSSLALSSRRAERYRRRGILWDVSTLERVRKCGRVRHDAQGVGLRRTSNGVSGFAGVCTCGSVWACPVCNAKVMVRRAIEIGGAVAAWQALGGECIFSTFTMRHHAGQGLQQLWDALSKAWGRVTSGKYWQADRKTFGIEGWLRAVEVTTGENGWHVHVHALLFVNEVQDLAVRELQASMFKRWRSALVKAGLAAPLLAGQDSHVVTGPADKALAEYFTKSIDQVHRIGLELTQSQSKAARRAFSTRSTWGLLDDVEETGELDAWAEWERVSKGRRQLTWSRGIRERLGLRREESDEEIAAKEIGTREDELLIITPMGWADLCQSPANLGVLLDVTDVGGLHAARAWLDEKGIDFVDV